MSVPKQKRNASARNRRRSHESLSSKQTNACSQCKKSMMGHRACQHCGTYKGKETIISKRIDKKIKRARQKAL